MHRRSFLAGVACSSAAVAGRLSVTEAAALQDDSSPETSPDPEPPADPDEPIARATIGPQSDDEPPHRVRLWNLDDEQRSVSLVIESADGTTALDGGYDLDPEAHAVVFLHGRDEYDLTVDIDGATNTTDLEASSFDDPCPGTELFVLENGEFESTTESDADHC
ncbi:hypothetical protein [Natronorubrum sp. FCH18a]|uniref:hypothetical protein n=1 Tax=Natronorubrum sp. FCH18a TaxID=3447018 RepID=UPI003F515A6B